MNTPSTNHIDADPLRKAITNAMEGHLIDDGSIGAVIAIGNDIDNAVRGLVVEPTFVVSAVNEKTGETEYVDIDRSAGGYLYWTGSIWRAEHYKESELKRSAPEFFHGQLTMMKGYKDFCILEVGMIATKVTVMDSQDAIKEQRKKELLAQRERIDRELEGLGG